MMSIQIKTQQCALGYTVVRMLSVNVFQQHGKHDNMAAEIRLVVPNADNAQTSQQTCVPIRVAGAATVTVTVRRKQH